MRRPCGGRLMRLSESNSTVWSIVISPRSGATSPAIMLTSVVLPAPEGPNTPVTPLPLWKRALREKSPSRFSTSTPSILFPVEAHAGAARKPFGGDQRGKRNRNGHQHQAAGRRISVGHLGVGVDGGRDGLRLARNVGHERDGGAELAERLGEAEQDAGNEAGQRQRQRHGQED